MNDDGSSVSEWTPRLRRMAPAALGEQYVNPVELITNLQQRIKGRIAMQAVA